MRRAQRVGNELPPVQMVRNVRNQRMNGTLYQGTVSGRMGPVVIHDARATAADMADRLFYLLWKLGCRVVSTAAKFGKGAMQDVFNATAPNPQPDGWELFTIREEREVEERV